MYVRATHKDLVGARVVDQRPWPVTDSMATRLDTVYIKHGYVYVNREYVTGYPNYKYRSSVWWISMEDAADVFAERSRIKSSAEADPQYCIAAHTELEQAYYDVRELSSRQELTLNVRRFYFMYAQCLVGMLKELEQAAERHQLKL